MNKLSTLPRGFGSFPMLEVLDLTYNNLTENSLPGNFFMIGELLLHSTQCTVSAYDRERNESGNLPGSWHLAP